MKDSPIRPVKRDLARKAVGDHHVTSIADLGACYLVNAGYTLDILENFDIDRAFVVDERITALSERRGKKFPQLTFVSGIMNEPSFIHSFEAVDALLMYDILLHQVNLDWDDFLSAWAEKARVLIIYNQMWKQFNETVRFITKGKEWYMANVYCSSDERVEAWYSRHGRTDPKTGRREEDVHNFWQWGITTEDLVAHVRSLGFRLDHFQNYGAFNPRTPWIENEGFIFVRN